MTVGWSDSVANSILNLIVNGTAFSAPAGCFAALYTNNGGAPEPGLSTIGSAVEASYAGYARPNLRTRMDVATGRQSASNAVLDFGTPTTPGDPGLVLMVWIGFWSASTAGTYLGHGTLTAAVTPVAGSSFSIAATNLVMRQT